MTGPMNRPFFSNYTQHIFSMDPNLDLNITVYKNLYNDQVSYGKDLIIKFQNDERIKGLTQQQEALTNEMESLQREVCKKKLAIEIITDSINTDKTEFIKDNPFPLASTLAELETKIIEKYRERTFKSPIPTTPTTLPIKNKMKQLWAKIMK